MRKVPYWSGKLFWGHASLPEFWAHVLTPGKKFPDCYKSFSKSVCVLDYVIVLLTYLASEGLTCNHYQMEGSCKTVPKHFHMRNHKSRSHFFNCLQKKAECGFSVGAVPPVLNTDGYDCRDLGCERQWPCVFSWCPDAVVGMSQFLFQTAVL